MYRPLVALLFAASLPAHAETFPTADGPVEVDNWAYLLQRAEPARLAAARHDLLVIDFARFGDGASKFTPQEIHDMQHSSDGPGGDGQRKVVVSYLSIGEASDFRDHWRAEWTRNGSANQPLTAAAPAWLGPFNPDWPESRKVRYWDPEWQAVIFNDAKTGWLDQIVAQGFDGAYLDIVDAYYFWGNESSGGGTSPAAKRPGDPADGQDAARRMARFIVEMTRHARQSHPKFFVIPQNGEFLLNDLRHGSAPEPGDDALAAEYLDAIAAIGIEDTYYRGDDDENNRLAIDTDKVAVLKQDFLAAGKPVLVVDYINQPAKVADFQKRARADGFIPYAAPTRALDRLAAPAR
ncbi:hypothetical protein Pla108_10870 [Botrimarina colliarenosi]|uniref:Glycoside-hydrolase family GH114 TIM-barrel domain-containing protein n=1 Tax=Botrimarina colliarenosi TaxID=2528001 RepID=A0A5C6AJB7_9BACT|nr:endo alpha-1,4 polygalactosaminidase [Botrimarina colliarenosi]TWU00143.1 hypothetical protein Pla108_10870 [Botrimarina colliarenosi]